MILSETKVGWIGAGKMGFPMSHCLLKSGVDVDRVGETPYLMLLEQNIEDAFDVSMARYNSRVTFVNEINRSLLTQARGAAESYKGDLAFTTGILKGAGDIYANRDEYRSLLS